jgi:serine/threonine protein kinase/Leucine-rich repeat (LRR) protein
MDIPPVPPPPPKKGSFGPLKRPSLPPAFAIRAEATFNSALARPAAERAAFVLQACGDQAEILAEVRALLASHEAAGDFLSTEAPTSPEIDEQLARLKPEEDGDRIGPYKLLQEIGAGGFGTVWMADQEKPVKRRVALKIIKMGMDTKEVIARFEQERQALAMMDHPNIARVFDAGATQYGRPFFVMELVRGVKITDYCDEQGLSTEERIKLFIHVCHAVQHAHQKGIIHRDLKPSNILVTINDGEAVPKVIDFGVAKATQGNLTDGTLFTKFEQMIGTPLYMSPEQAEMTSLDVDTRSDIYALGVLLYELLTGRTPIDTGTMARAGMDEIRRLIRDFDPPRPSQRLKTLDGNELTTMAKRRHTEPAKLSGSLRGDLDWIVMKCLEKDRKRRYDTANGLALDLQRHLLNEVVIARPPTTGYLLSKLIKRNKSPFIAGCTVVMALILGFAVSVWQARRANREADRAVTAFDELRATAPAFAEQARGLAARERYDEAIEKLDYAIKLRPEAAEYLVAKGDLLQCQLKLKEAAEVYREALRVNPGLARAETSAKLCEELLVAPLGSDGKLTRASLGKLHLAMQQQQRSAAELLPVARLLGEEKALLVATWLERLKDLPISAEKPLKDRLTVRDDGLLELDLKGTQIADLATLIGMPLGKLVLWDCKQLNDFTPLREFRSLTYLDLDSTQIADLSPLHGLPLQELWLNATKVSDLSALRGMKLKTLGVWNVSVADLSPLAGMPLTEFSASMIPAIDFSPLKGAPLENFSLGYSQVRDLSFLADSPIKGLYLHGSDAVRGWALLAGLKSLERLVLPRNYRNWPDEELVALAALRAHPALKWIQADPGEGESARWQMIRATQPKEIFWQDWDREQAFLPAIRNAGFKFSLAKLPDGTYSLSITNQPLTDLSFLKGAPISELTLSNCQITDLAPIRNLPLRQLMVGGNPVVDLAPLRDLPLERLGLRAGSFSDLSPLAGLRLRELYLDGSANVTDVSALTEIKTLEKLTLPAQARNIGALKKLTEMQMLSFKATDKAPFLPTSTAAVFWKEYERDSWRTELLDKLLVAGLKPKVFKQLEDKTWEMDLGKSDLSDLTILSGAPISSLKIGQSKVTDLAPLRGMQLKKLAINETKVTDLSPLEGMPIEELFLSNTKVANLSVLQHMPLKWLTLRNCSELTDLSALANNKSLKVLTLPPNAANIGFLRDLPQLERLGYRDSKSDGELPGQPRDEFWKEYDAKRK